MAGNVVHYEISATDVDRAQGFWSGLFGWQFGESAMPEGEYRMAQTGEQSGGALSSHGEPGWFTACRDTEGNAFSLWQGDRSAG
jgi:predicted enzyme related to lactoylglutathione lyase